VLDDFSQLNEMATRLCTGCGRFGEAKNLKVYAGHWKHTGCASAPSTFPDKVLCVVCLTATDENKTKLRKSGFKCTKCVGKAHRPDVLSRIDGKGPETKELKRVQSGLSPSSQPTISCVTCSLQLRVPPGATLITCPNCRTLMNQNDRDLRFMNCGSCRSLLQFSLQLIRSNNSPQPILQCGRCHITNYIPQSILSPQRPLTIATPSVIQSGVQSTPIPTPRRHSLTHSQHGQGQQQQQQQQQPVVVSTPKIVAIEEKEEKKNYSLCITKFTHT